MSDIIKCPYCESFCEADFVDVGVGMVQCGPYHCDNCLSSQIGLYDKERELTPLEKEYGWYQPDSEPGSSANVINGKIVSAEVMKATYRDHFKDNILWNDKSYVEDWYDDIRKKKEIMNE